MPFPHSTAIVEIVRLLELVCSQCYTFLTRFARDEHPILIHSSNHHPTIRPKPDPATLHSVQPRPHPRPTCGYKDLLYTSSSRTSSYIKTTYPDTSRLNSTWLYVRTYMHTNVEYNPAFRLRNSDIHSQSNFILFFHYESTNIFPASGRYSYKISDGMISKYTDKYDVHSLSKSKSILQRSSNLTRHG